MKLRILVLARRRRMASMRRIFVISDLHLGGRPDRVDQSGNLVPGFQICNSYKELVSFIDWLTKLGKQSPDEELELVINGDIVDFLAEDDYETELPAQIWTADESEVISKLNRIAERTRQNSKRGVFEALKDFRAAGNRLTLLIGNHDVELSLPAVRRHLYSVLGDDTGTLKFIYDGEAYTVGKVLIEHGNRYDVWNMIDHSALRQERSMRSRKLSVGEEDREERYFIPPSGTHLVIEFMNRIKARYRFIDLLKPETNALIPILIALEPEKWLELERVIKTGSVLKQILSHVNRYFLGKLASPTMPESPGNLGTLGASEEDSAPLHGGESLDSIARRSFESLSLENILRATLQEDAELFPAPEHARTSSVPKEKDFEDDLGELGLLSDDSDEVDQGNLGLSEYIADFWRATKRRLEPFIPGPDSASAYFKQAKEKISEARYKQLHAALRRLNRNDGSFNTGLELDEYKQAAAETATTGDFEAIVYGHTHLPKKLLLTDSPARRWYLNTGTWADVIRLPEELAGNYASAGKELKNFVSALKQNDFSRYVHRYLSFVELVVDLKNDGAVRSAELYSFAGEGKERSAPLTNILQT
jgi:UDP-2,3-diacylglucosamine pyrophosphatase LpxH